MDIKKLMADITPIYNLYKRSSKTITGAEAIGMMWDIGDVIQDFVNKNKVAPHKLFRIVYGKSEGKENISQKSYITREFQGKCLRIRKMFHEKDEIIAKLPRLKSFTLFREAMPFFDNPKYILKGAEQKSLLELLNSGKSYKEIREHIHKLQKSKIGISNTRKQKLESVSPHSQIFIDFYNSIYRVKQEGPQIIEIKLKENHIDAKYLMVLARNTNALTQDGLKYEDFKVPLHAVDPVWEKYFEMVKEFSSHKDAIKLRRFRRLIPAERIVRLADMLYELAQKTYK